MKSVTRASTPRRSFRTVLLATFVGLVLFTSKGGPIAASPSEGNAAADPGAVAGIRPETRLRKLHLVRPDLIPYPIAYEVYC